MSWKCPCRIRFSLAVDSASTPDFCATYPIARRTLPGLRATSNPATFTSPESAAESVVRIFTVVDFPAPLGPRSAKTDPVFTVKLNPSRAGSVKQV